MKSTTTTKVLAISFAVCLLACVAKSAYAAWDGSAIGRVGDIYVSGTGVTYFNLEGFPPLCVSGGSDRTIGLLYVPLQNDAMVDRAGGEALVALLTSAKLAGHTVTVFAKNGSTWGCLVGGIQIH